jgi:hypothetical protein
LRRRFDQGRRLRPRTRVATATKNEIFKEFGAGQSGSDISQAGALDQLSENPQTATGGRVKILHQRRHVRDGVTHQSLPDTRYYAKLCAKFLARDKARKTNGINHLG